jgi:fructuronate reductase
MQTLLTPIHLADIAARGVAVPGYARGGEAGVVHLGLGAFHRAHQALVFDALLGHGDARWGVHGVAMRNPAVADALAAQAGLYAVQIASNEGSHWQIGGAVWHTSVAAREPDAVIRALAAASTRWVTLTVTEKGYGPSLAELLVKGLAMRRDAGRTGLTIASCDNLPNNGRQLEALCLDAARSIDPALADWIAESCAFPNSMVDRIVPAATASRLAAAADALGLTDQAALGTEAFWEWVIELRFVDAADADALASAGVTVVDDVKPFEEAKLRMLNGSHTAMACLGAVAALPFISDCIGQPAVAAFVYGLMTEEVGPALARPDWPQYRDALLKRFANPALQHSVHQIAGDSSKKIPQRWPPAVLAAMQRGQPTDRLAFAGAAWMRYLRGSDELGRPYAMNDPMAAELQALALKHAGNAPASVQALGTLPTIWGDVLPTHADWLARIARHVHLIDTLGMLPALASFSSSSAS